MTLINRALWESLTDHVTTDQLLFTLQSTLMNFSMRQHLPESGEPPTAYPQSTSQR